ncbi:hypothetical protein ABIB34_003714 [Rhodococcus sp. UYP5]
MIVTAPETLGTQLRGRTTTALLYACIALEPHLHALTDPTNARMFALRSLARRCRKLRRDADEFKKHMPTLVTTTAPQTSGRPEGP